MNVADTLREARRRIEDPEKWGNGKELLLGKRCAWTALYSCRLDAMSPERGKAEAIFRSAIDGGSIWQWNDAPERTHAEVLAAFDRAIALAERADATAEHERLAVAAAMREAANVSWRPGDAPLDAERAEAINRILALIPETDAQAIDAHDAALWNEAMEAAASIADNYGREGDRLSKEYACETADEIASRIRALKREKRGGE